jgi:hypothetical protein
MKLAKAAVLLTLASAAARAQVNTGEQKSEASALIHVTPK